jgi:hypothetical protein
LKRFVVQRLFQRLGKDFTAVQEDIDENLAPRSFALEGARVSLSLDVERRESIVQNVLGYLPPPEATGHEEILVIGAHYDHLGIGGGRNSRARDGEDVIHNGADDNASGVAAMLELARIFAAGRDSLKRGIVFVGFVGEEIGVLGSTFYVNNPVVPLEKTALMLNLDTIGRMRERKLYAAGVGSSPVIKGLVERANENDRAALKIETSEGGYGPSDHFPFYGKNVPVLFFFTGANEDYHKVTDDWQKINVEGLASVVELSSRILAELVFTDLPVPFTRAAADTAGPPGGEGYGRGTGAHFGIVPDFGGEPGKGAKITGTGAGSPAEKAGLRPGDVIVKFAGKTITGLQDLSYALRDKKPGDEVEVVVVRDGKEMVLRATLDRRGAK